MKRYTCKERLKKVHSRVLCVIPTLKEATELSSLKSQLQHLQVPLFAVVKENLGKELDGFKKFFSGKVYVDHKVCFYTSGGKPASGRNGKAVFYVVFFY